VREIRVLGQRATKE